MNVLQKLFSKEVILYIFIGFSGLFLDLILFWVMADKLGWEYQISNWLSTSVGITNNFLLNAYFNFKKKDRLLARFSKFYLIGCLGIGLTALMLFLGVELLHAPPIIVKCVSVVFVFVVQYTFNKRYSFS